MKAGHGQIAPDRMKYLLFQGEEYLRTLGSIWRRINNIIEQARGLSVNYYVMTAELLFEDAMEFSAGLGEIYSCLHNLVMQFKGMVIFLSPGGGGEKGKRFCGKYLIPFLELTKLCASPRNLP